MKLGSESRLSLAVAFLVLCLLANGAWAAAGLNLRLRADPDRAPADGKSAVAVMVELVDPLGRPAPDGTPVYFATTLGQINSPVQAVGGLAQTVLTASNAAGTAVVSAIAGGVRQTIQVEFLAQPGSATRGSRVVELTADEIAYSAGKRVFAATWQAILKHQAVVIRADGIQYDMGAGLVCAQGNVTLSSGGRTIKADALRYDLITLKGRLVRLADPPERLTVEGGKLETHPDRSDDAALWEPIKTDDTRTWVKAKRAIVYPGEKIILDHATFYVGDTKVMSLPRHVLDPQNGSAVFGQVLAFSSASGVALDFPMYYRANAEHIGSLHIGRNRTLGGYQSGPGWSLGLREEYLRDGRTGGAFELDDLLHPNRGVKWEHRQELGSRMSLNADASTVQFDRSGPRLRSSTLGLLRSMSDGKVSLTLARSDYGGSVQSIGDLEYRLESLRPSSGMLITPAVHLRNSMARTQNLLVLDPETGEPLEIAQRTERVTSPGLDANISLPSKDLGRDLFFSGGLTTGYGWNLGGGSRALLDGRLLLDRRFGQYAFASLAFSYSSGSLTQNSLFRTGRQLFTLSGHTLVKRTAVRLSLSQDLAGQRRFGTLFLHRPLPFGTDLLGRPLWDFELSHVFSRFESLGAANTKFALGRALGRLQASLCYSPQGVGDFSGRPWLGPFGYGYTYSGGRHLWFEVTARQH
jgi:hypothetical protein